MYHGLVSISVYWTHGSAGSLYLDPIFQGWSAWNHPNVRSVVAFLAHLKWFKHQKIGNKVIQYLRRNTEKGTWKRDLRLASSAIMECGSRESHRWLHVGDRCSWNTYMSKSEERCIQTNLKYWQLPWTRGINFILWGQLNVSSHSTPMQPYQYPAHETFLALALSCAPLSFPLTFSIFEALTSD